MRKYRILYVLLWIPLMVVQILWFIPGIFYEYGLLEWLIPLFMMSYGHIKGGKAHWYQHFPINTNMRH